MVFFVNTSVCVFGGMQLKDVRSGIWTSLLSKLLYYYYLIFLFFIPIFIFYLLQHYIYYYLFYYIILILIINILLCIVNNNNIIYIILFKAKAPRSKSMKADLHPYSDTWVTLRPVLYLKNLEIYFSRDLQNLETVPPKLHQ